MSMSLLSGKFVQFHLLTKFVQFYSRISRAIAGQFRAVLFRAIPKVMSIRAIPFPSNSALPANGA